MDFNYLLRAIMNCSWLNLGKSLISESPPFQFFSPFHSPLSTLILLKQASGRSGEGVRLENRWQNHKGKRKVLLRVKTKTGNTTDQTYSICCDATPCMTVSSPNRGMLAMVQPTKRASLWWGHGPKLQRAYLFFSLLICRMPLFLFSFRMVTVRVPSDSCWL
jgi:hypothetical protein